MCCYIKIVIAESVLKQNKNTCCNMKTCVLLMFFFLFPARKTQMGHIQFSDQ